MTGYLVHPRSDSPDVLFTARSRQQLGIVVSEHDLAVVLVMWADGRMIYEPKRWLKVLRQVKCTT